MSLFDSGIRPAVDEYLLKLAAEKRDYGQYWSASQAGYCQRKVLFERLGVPHVETEDTARRQRVFTAGHLFHAWMQGITKDAGLSIASEVELQDEALMVRGHFDDLIMVDGKLLLIDYKTRNSRNFNFSKSPSYFHRLQLGTYTYMLRQMQKEDVKPAWLDNLPELKEARTLNIEKDTLRMSEVQYLYDDQLETDVLGYWNSLNGHWKAQTFPPCTCADHENGFMAKEKWNPYYAYGEPCSIKLYEEWRDAQANAKTS